MTDYYYGTSASLGWILSHYFYGGLHFTWLAVEYYPYRLPNPKSSNPHLIYQDLYQPWRDRDDFDKIVQQTRANLHKGVAAQEIAGTISTAVAARLKDICALVDIAFLYPIVYRVDIASIPAARRIISGSGLRGSCEYLVPDLAEHEFTLLFVDYVTDPDFRILVVDEAARISSTTSAAAMIMLEGRC
jgi:hypothetical protein